MPTVVIPVTYAEQDGRTYTLLGAKKALGSDERDFVHSFGADLVARGFRLRPGKWRLDRETGKYVGIPNADGPALIPDPPLTYARETDKLTVTQDVPGRVSDKAPMLRGLMWQLAQGNVAALPQLRGFLMSEGDDRAAMIDAMAVGVPEEAMVGADSGTQGGLRGSLPSDELVSAEVIGARKLMRKVMLLFGAVEERL